MKKSEIVRSMIRDVKAAGATEPTEELIKAAMEATGHTRQLTRAYIKNNWPRVVLEAVEAASEAAGAAPAEDAPKSKRKSKAKAAPTVAEVVATEEVPVEA